MNEVSLKILHGPCYTCLHLHTVAIWKFLAVYDAIPSEIYSQTYFAKGHMYKHSDWCSFIYARCYNMNPRTSHSSFMYCIHTSVGTSNTCSLMKMSFINYVDHQDFNTGYIYTVYWDRFHQNCHENMLISWTFTKLQLSAVLYVIVANWV